MSGMVNIDPELAQRLPLRILVVEDNEVNQLVARRLFERFGYTIAIAANGQEGLVAVLSQPYDLIFMDIQMPELDGLETTRRIRSLEAAGKLPHSPLRIVALTANALPNDRFACLAAGMNDYVTKPVQVSAVRRILEEMVNH